MPANKDFALRVEIIDVCLRNNQRKWTLDALVQEVDDQLYEMYGKTTSRRTIQNDIKYLIQEKNAPINKKKEGNIVYFYYLENNFSIKNLPVEPEEVARLNDALAILRQVNDFQVVQEVEEVIVKLQHTINTDVEKSPAIIQFENHTNALGTEYIDDIFLAIKNKMPLRITYQSFKATEAEEAVFHPYLLKEYRNRWFVIGRKNEATVITNLALDRIKKIKNSQATYMPNNLIDTSIYYNNLVGVSIPQNASVENVEIKVAAALAPYIKTKPVHHSQKISKELKNGSLVITLKVINNFELRSVLLSYGCEMEVMKPITLRSQLKQQFEAGAKCYQ